jgi:hypothetical protein
MGPVGGAAGWGGVALSSFFSRLQQANPLQHLDDWGFLSLGMTSEFRLLTGFPLTIVSLSD